MVREAFSRLEPALEVNEAQLALAAEHAAALGYLPRKEVQGVVDTRLLRQVLGPEAR